MTNTEQLKFIEILKTVPEVKELVEELRFGCVIQWISCNPQHLDYITEKARYLKWKWIYKTILWYLDENINIRWGDYEVIWLIELNHLLMFLESKGYRSYIDYMWLNISVFDWWKLVDRKKIKMDTKKNLMNQEESFYKEFNQFAEENFNIKL